MIGGHRYALPAAVFEGGEVETGPVGTFLIELAWPEMRPLTPEERAMWPPRDTIRVLANSAAPVDGQAVPETKLEAAIPEEISVATALSSGIDERASGHIPVPVPDPRDVAQADAVPGAGMVRVQTEEPSRGDEVHYDVFVRAPIVEQRELIQCARLQSVPVPSCAQSFVADNLIIKISYERKLVPQWQEIHTRFLAFLRSHKVK